MMKDYLLGLSAALVGLSLLPAGTPRLARYTFTEVHMGTRFRIVLYAPDEATAKLAVKAAFARAAELDDIMSDYKPASELMRLCKKAGGEPVRVSEDLFAILVRSQDVARRSGGAFDVTVGPLVRLWRRARRTRKLPDPKELARALKLVGFDKIRLDPKGRTVQLLVAGMLLDLGGIAKGYAAEEMLAVLRRYGVTRALVAASGDIAAGDAPPATAGWKVGLAPLLDPDADPEHYVLLKHAAVSTAGDAQQHVEIGGQRYSHIIDPRTGMALVGRSSVSVIAPDGTTTDGLDTALSVMGPKAGLRLVEATDAAACIFTREGKKGVETFISRRFPEYEYHDKVPAGGPQEECRTGQREYRMSNKECRIARENTATAPGPESPLFCLAVRHSLFDIRYSPWPVLCSPLPVDR
jgi:thiamine biosynthesis lipoprotein